MEVGVKESSKKKLVRSTVQKTAQREQMPRKCRGNGGEEEDRNCDGRVH